MVETCYIPKDLSEALRIRKETGAHPIQGGTDLMVQYRRRAGMVPQFPFPVMIITQLEELKGIRFSDDDISIGSGVTCHELEIENRLPYQITKAASLMGAQSLRNLATIGGNICNASPKGDLPVPLVLYDAKVELISATATREVPLQEFIIGAKRTALQDDELLSRIIVPRYNDESTYHYYRKIGTRRANAISKLSLAALMRVDGSVVVDFRACSGAAGPKIMRNREVEHMLIGLEVSELSQKMEEFLLSYDALLSPQAMPQYRRSSTKKMLEYVITEVSTLPKEKILV